MSSSFTPIPPSRPASPVQASLELDELDGLLSEESEEFEQEIPTYKCETVRSPAFSSSEDSEDEDSDLGEGEYLDDGLEEEEVYSALPVTERRAFTQLKPITGNPQTKIAKIKAEVESSAKTRKPRKDAGVPRGSKGPGSRVCSLCKQAGHNMKTCPKNITALEARDKKALAMAARMESGRTITCSYCKEAGHNSRTCELKNDPDFIPDVQFKSTRSSTTTCSVCGEKGHNKATCGRRPDKTESVQVLQEFGGVIEL